MTGSAKKQQHCLTYAPQQGLLREIPSPFGICAAYDPATPVDQRPAMSKFQAIWDTGATNSAISQTVIDTCGLQPISMAMVGSAHGSELRSVFLGNIGIYNGPTIENVLVTHADLAGSDALIGMDIITLGDFAITNENGPTTFSFRIPSLHTVDYVKEFNQIKTPWGVGPPGGHGKRKRKH